MGRAPTVMVARNHTHHTSSTRSFSSSSSQGQSRGALAGGFSKENFAGWAQREWGKADVSDDKEPDHYIDLFAAKISGPCAAMLEQHPHPSSALARAMFQSIRFTPERWILSIFIPSANRELPDVFQRKSSYLMFHAADVSPHEIIFKWSATGCTMLAVDPKVRRCYLLGSGIKSSRFLAGSLFQKILTPLHIRYSQFLIDGAVNELERQAEELEQKADN